MKLKGLYSMSNYLIVMIVMQCMAFFGMWCDIFLHGDKDITNVIINNELIIFGWGSTVVIATMEVTNLWLLH